MERAVEPHVDVIVAGILVEMKERSRTPREGAALALTQLRELAELHEQCLDLIKVFRRCVPHTQIMTLTRRTRMLALAARKHSLTARHSGLTRQSGIGDSTQVDGPDRRFGDSAYPARSAAMNHSYAGMRVACGSHPLITPISRQYCSTLGSLNFSIVCANSTR